MMRRLMLIWLVVAAQTFGSTYYVATTGNDTTGDGSSGTPWATIQKAVTTISTETPHTVLVAPGTYAETTNNYLYINVAVQVTIQANGGTVTLSTSNTDQVVRLHTGMDAGTSYVVLDGLTLTPQTAAGTGAVYVSALTPALTIRNCTINPSGTAVRYAASASAEATRTLTIEDSTLNAGTAYGLNVEDAASIVIDDSTILAGSQAVYARATNADSNPCSVLLKVTGSTLGQGILAETYWDSVVATGNTITINKASGATVGIAIGKDTAENATPIGRTLISGNTISYTGADNSHGILIGPGCLGAYVTGNTIKGADIGIVVKGDCTVTDKLASCAKIIGNKVYGPRGIYLKGSSKNLVRNNTVVVTAGSGTAALELETETRTSAYTSTDNTVTENIFDAGGVAGYAVRDYSNTGTNIRNVYDYNVLRAGTGGLFRVQATEYATLAALQAAWASDLLLSGNDANSLVGDPKLASPAFGDFSVAANSPAFGAGSDSSTIGAWQPNPLLKYGTQGVYGTHGGR